jgi:hypothetical protein
MKLLLAPIQKQKQQEFEKNKWPIGFIVGNPRSGTTLLLQWLASLEVFSYPTNILTRFAYAPYVGALIQKMLFAPEFDFHEDFKDIESGINFKSNLGKSKGALATNEFQHFFRNYMPNFDPEYLNDEEIEVVDFVGIKKGLTSIEQGFEKPFVTKAMMLLFNLLTLFNNIPNSIFIYMKREPIYNMQSIYLSRVKYYNKSDLWWSVKPKEYAFLKDMDVYHQIAGQIYFTKKSIENILQKIPDKNYIAIEYKNFCRKPNKIYNELVSKYKANGFEITQVYNGENNFSLNNIIKLPKSEIDKFEKAYEHFESQ